MKESKQAHNDRPGGKAPKTTRRDRAILALLQHPTIEKAAAAADVHPATLYRWIKQPEFRDQFMAARTAAFSQCSARLQQAAPAAANRLLRILMQEDAPLGCVIRACDAILNRSERSFQLEVLEARLSKLEHRSENRTAPKPSQGA